MPTIAVIGQKVKHSEKIKPNNISPYAKAPHEDHLWFHSQTYFCEVRTAALPAALLSRFKEYDLHCYNNQEKKKKDC
jgi:hypothetical protein